MNGSCACLMHGEGERSEHDYGAGGVEWREMTFGKRAACAYYLCLFESTRLSSLGKEKAQAR